MIFFAITSQLFFTERRSLGYDRSHNWDFLPQLITKLESERLESFLENLRPTQPEALKNLLLCLDDNKFSALHYAVRCSNVETVKVLLKYGADPNRQGKEGFTPLHILARLVINLKILILRILRFRSSMNDETKLEYLVYYNYVFIFTHNIILSLWF